MANDADIVITTAIVTIRMVDHVPPLVIGKLPVDDRDHRLQNGEDTARIAWTDLDLEIEGHPVESQGHQNGGGTEKDGITADECRNSRPDVICSYPDV